MSFHSRQTDRGDFVFYADRLVIIGFNILIQSVKTRFLH